MDKLREEFEAWYENNNDFLINTQFEMEGNRYLDRHVRMAWLAWQASSIPDGYVIVPKEPSFTTMQRMNESLISNIDETAKYRMQQIYKAMIEAVEKNDE